MLEIDKPVNVNVPVNVPGHIKFRCRVPGIECQQGRSLPDPREPDP